MFESQSSSQTRCPTLFPPRCVTLFVRGWAPSLRVLAVRSSINLLSCTTYLLQLFFHVGFTNVLVVAQGPMVRLYNPRGGSDGGGLRPVAFQKQKPMYQFLVKHNGDKQSQEF